MDSLFTYRDEIEGKVGIGRLPNELQSILDNISKEFFSTTLNVLNIFNWLKLVNTNSKSPPESRT